MAFKWINPGFPNVYDSHDSFNYTAYKNISKNISSSGRYYNNPGNHYINLPDNVKELYIKFDLYNKSNMVADYNWTFDILDKNNKKVFRLTHLEGNYSGTQVMWVHDGYKGDKTDIVADYIGVTNIYMHIKINDGKYLMEYFFNGERRFIRNGECTGDTPLSKIQICNRMGYHDQTHELCNIIISTEEIDFSEQVVRIPYETINSLDTYETNSYQVTSSEQQIAIKPKINDPSYSESTVVTGVCLATEKIYRDGKGLDNALFLINGSEIQNKEILINNRRGMQFSCGLNDISINDFNEYMIQQKFNKKS